MYNSLQLSADRRYSNGLKVGVAYTLGKSEDNASDKRNVLWNTYDDTNYWGPSSFDRRHVLSIYYIYDLPFWRDADQLVQNIARRLADLRRDVRAHRARRSRSPATNDIARRVGDSGIGQPVDSSAIRRGRQRPVLGHGIATTTSGSTRRRSRSPAAGTFGNSTRNILPEPGRSAVGHRALQELRAARAHTGCSCAWRSSTSRTIRT